MRMRTTREAGFTLIEVMAADVIFSIAMTAVYATFTFQHKSYTTQSYVAQMQENFRDAMVPLNRDIRLAGYGIPAPVTIPDNTVASGVTNIRSLYPVDKTTGPDALYIMYLYDMDGNQPPTTISSPMPNPSAEFNVAQVTGFQIGDLCFINNGSAADMFEITQVQGGSLKIQHNPGLFPTDYNDPGGHNTFPPAGYDTGSTIAKARFLRYYVDSTTDPSHPTLMVDRMGGAPAQPVADDIEDMQFQYFLDTDFDGVPDTWSDNPGDLTQIRQVRILLCARTKFPEKGWQEVRPTLGNHPAGTGADGYRRRVLAITVDVRNAGI
jgi:prepilin-type N-terminal cleavage/methylation domain-containing protein